MPTRPPHYCATPGCDQLTHRTRCPRHTTQTATANDRQYRDPERRKVYNSKRWKVLRRYVLSEQPRCATDGCMNWATDVDHITPLRQGGKPYDRNNLEALCHSHHSTKTAHEIGLGRGTG